MMRRRSLLKGLLGAAGGMYAGFRLPLANAADYGGKFLVSVQADGGWDPTSFCDPKTNMRGEQIINNWAKTQEIRTAGNIAYAPFAANQAFFEKHHKRMLVINGVDAQTNSHTVGIVHNWSGRNAEGAPTLTALLAAQHGADLPMPYLSFGGYSTTGGTTRFTRITQPGRLRAIAAPAASEENPNEPFFNAADWTTLRTHMANRSQRMVASPSVLPAETHNRALYRSSFAAEGLKAYVDALPADEMLEPTQSYAGDSDTYYSELRRQAQLAVLAFKTGVAVSADLWNWGFDTHDNHDGDHAWLLGDLTDAVDYLWSYAEVHGIADRLVVVIGSDFGRTNRYNAANGKDHWPIGSVVVMQDDQSWTNRVVGETDELHFARNINPTTLRPDAQNGTRIHPKHVHKALRRHLGLENTVAAQRFPFANTEDFAFFG